MILLTRALREVNECGLLRDEHFGLRPILNTMLHFARLAERVNRNFDKKSVTVVVFLDDAKEFDAVWVKGLFYRVSFLNFSSHLAQTMSSYFHCRTF
jgi:hypothetical protein